MKAFPAHVLVKANQNYKIAIRFTDPDLSTNTSETRVSLASSAGPLLCASNAPGPTCAIPLRTLNPELVVL